MDSGKHTCDLQSFCSFSVIPESLPPSLNYLLNPYGFVFSGFHSIDFCWTVFITSTLSVFTSYNMNSETIHFIVPICYCSWSSSQIQFQSSVSNTKFTIFFPWKLIFLHIFCISVNGTQCPSISYRMTFPLLTPNSITKTNSVFLLNSFLIFPIFFIFTFLAQAFNITYLQLLIATIYWEFTIC